MIFADKCYTYNLTERKQARIRKRIRRHKPVRNLYVIVLPLLQDGLLEIYPYNQLLQNHIGSWIPGYGLSALQEAKKWQNSSYCRSYRICMMKPGKNGR